jgi:hypothetical protein
MYLFLALSPIIVLGQAAMFPDIAAAATKVPVTSVAEAPLLEAETLQLTNEVIERLANDSVTSDYAEYFAFDDANGSWTRHASSTPCKNLSRRPQLAQRHRMGCVQSDARWGINSHEAHCGIMLRLTMRQKKNAAKCTDIISNFTDAYFHQHNPTFKILAYLPGKNLYAKE